ncbi:MAG: hypothetical protein ABEI58_00780 [Candidatus Nanohaloarchaea archaeon]
MDDYPGENRQKTRWNQTLDDYIQLYTEKKGLDLEPEDLASYPEEPIPNETEFWLVKREVDEEIDEMLEGPV